MTIDFAITATVERDASSTPIDVIIELFDADAPASVLKSQTLTFDFTLTNSFGLQSTVLATKITTAKNISIRTRTSNNSVITTNFSLIVGYSIGLTSSTSGGYNETIIASGSFLPNEDLSISETFNNFNQIIVQGTISGKVYTNTFSTSLLNSSGNNYFIENGSDILSIIVTISFNGLKNSTLSTINDIIVIGIFRKTTLLNKKNNKGKINKTLPPKHIISNVNAINKINAMNIMSKTGDMGDKRDKYIEIDGIKHYYKGGS